MQIYDTILRWFGKFKRARKKYFFGMDSIKKCIKK